MNNNLAVFDFDGTLTTKDTLFDFIRFYKGTYKLYVGLIALSPVLIKYKIGLESNNKAKEILFSYFFNNENYTYFKSKCNAYKYRIDKIMYNDSLQELRKHQRQNDKILIISASIKEWIEPWAKSQNIEVIATNIEVIDNTITGRFMSKNCYGIEKVNRLKELYPDRNNYHLCAYGDSDGDRELLEYSDIPTLYKR